VIDPPRAARPHPRSLDLLERGEQFGKVLVTVP